MGGIPGSSKGCNTCRRRKKGVSESDESGSVPDHQSHACRTYAVAHVSLTLGSILHSNGDEAHAPPEHSPVDTMHGTTLS